MEKRENQNTQKNPEYFLKLLRSPQFLYQFLGFLFIAFMTQRMIQIRKNKCKSQLQKSGQENIQKQQPQQEQQKQNAQIEQQQQNQPVDRFSKARQDIEDFFEFQAKRKQQELERQSKQKPYIEALKNDPLRLQYIDNVPEKDEEFKKTNDLAPSYITSTQHDILERKLLDQQRYNCQYKPTYKFTGLIASLTSAYNYLFSFLGQGDDNVITVDEFLDFLNIDHTKLEKNIIMNHDQIFENFSNFCESKQKGAYGEVLWKLRNEPKVLKQSNQVKQEIEEIIRYKQKKVIIVQIGEVYQVVIGFEITPFRGVDALKPLKDIEPRNQYFSLFLGDSELDYKPFRCAFWEHICDDIVRQDGIVKDIRTGIYNIDENIKNDACLFVLQAL